MVSSERIQDNLRALASIGATPEGGATRLAWSLEERQAHGLAKQWMREAGLDVWEDPLGNTFGRREGQDNSLPTIMIGSHLDTVNNAGNFDGTLGFVGAMEAIRSLNEDGLTTRHPITVAVFAAEEAVRFADTCMGSKIITSQMERAELDHLKDAQGVTPAQAMREIGLDPDRIEEIRWDPASIAAYLELHIEQGLVLEGLGKRVGVVTAIAAATRYRVTLEGSADHSGATPMGARRDALAAASEIVLGVERIASEEAGPTTVGTVGVLKVKPGAMTIIPGWAELGIDIRDTVPEDKRTASEKVEAMIREACERRNIGVLLEQLIDHAPAKMDETVQEAMRRAAEKLGHEYHIMPSAAGHDARIMAFVTRAGLLFIPSKGGISHSPKEYTAPEDVLAGIEVLSEATRQVDESL